MMISARIFLILLVPLLVHGAPTGGNPPGHPAQGTVSWLLNPTPESPKPHSGPPTGDNPSGGPALGTVPWLLNPAPESPKPHSSQTVDPPGHPALGTVPWLLNPAPESPKPHSGQTVDTTPHSGQTVDLTNVMNQSPHLPLVESTSGSAHPDLAHINRLESLPATTCRLKTGTMYLHGPPSIPKPLLQTLEHPMKTTQSGIFFTLQGDMIFVPEGTSVKPSNQISLPPVAKTEIKVMDNKDPRLAKVGIFPEGSMWARRKYPQDHSNQLKSVASTNKIMIVTTPGPNGKMIYVTHRTTIIVLPGILRLPDVGTDIREITEADQTRITDWCNEAYPEYNRRMKDKMGREQYDHYCFNINLWHVWSRDWARVNVGDKPKSRGQWNTYAPL